MLISVGNSGSREAKIFNDMCNAASLTNPVQTVQTVRPVQPLKSDRGPSVLGHAIATVGTDNDCSETAQLIRRASVLDVVPQQRT